MNYNTPIFIRLHRNEIEVMVNVQTINSVEPVSNNLTHIYLNHCNDPLMVDDTYAEIQKKLLNVSIIL